MNAPAAIAAGLFEASGRIVTTFAAHLVGSLPHRRTAPTRRAAHRPSLSRRRPGGAEDSRPGLRCGCSASR